MTRSKLKLLLVLVIVAIIGLSASVLLIPKPQGADETIFYSPTGMPVTLAEALFGVGSALFFFMARRNFKNELRPAYWLLAGGTFASGVLALLIPYIEYNGLWGNQIFVTLSYLPYFLIGIFMYFGIRRFYLALGFGGFVSRLPIMLAVALVALTLYNFIPHVDTWADLPHEWQYNAMQTLTVFPAIAINAALFMAIRSLNRTGYDYRKPFGWLVAGIGFEAIALTTATVLQVIGYDNWYFNTRSYEAPYILATMSYLISGYYFMGIGLRRSRRRGSQTVTSFDLISHLAAKVSDPQKIDPQIDSVRIISSQLNPGQAPTPEDQETLRQTYLDIESFLIHDDPLRKFTKEDLRAELNDRFGLEGDNGQTFWKDLPK